MFCKATLVTAALALMAAASPVNEAREPRKLSSGMHIPLHKRNGLKSANGIFNFEAAGREVTKLKQ